MSGIGDGIVHVCSVHDKPIPCVECGGSLRILPPTEQVQSTRDPMKDAIGKTIGECDVRTEETLLSDKDFTRNDLLMIHKQLCEEAYDLMSKKNQDYAQADSPFANFEAAESIGVSGKDSLLARFVEKLRRIANLMHRQGQHVVAETLRDTCRDAINFVVLCYGYAVKKGWTTK